MHYFWIDIVLHWSCYLDYCWWIIQNSSFILHKKLSCHETTRNSILGNTKPRIDNNSKMTNYGDDCGDDDKLCCYWWLWVQTMKMTVMMMTSFVVIDDYKMMTTMKMIVILRLSYFVIDYYKLMTIWQTMIMIVIADVELLCWWWQWWPTMKTRRTVPGQIVINVFSTNLLKRKIRLNDNAKKKLKPEYLKWTRWNLNIILIKRAVITFIIISTNKQDFPQTPSIISQTTF